MSVSEGKTFIVFWFSLTESLFDDMSSILLQVEDRTPVLVGVSLTESTVEDRTLVLVGVRLTESTVEDRTPVLVGVRLTESTVEDRTLVEVRLVKLL